MPTANYNLPTISGEEAVNIVGDMNALANAADAALKKVSDEYLEPYTLPTASRTVKGGVIVGDGLYISKAGVLSTSGDGPEPAIPAATPSSLGGVIVGDGLAIDKDGVLSTIERSLADGSVSTSKLANGAVTSEKLGDSSVTAAKIADGSVTRTKLDASTQDAIAKIGNALTTDSAKAWVIKQIYSSNNVIVVHASNQALNLAYVKIYLDDYAATSTRFSVGTVPPEGRPGRNQYQYITRDATAGNVSIEVIAASGAVSLLTDATGGTVYGGATLMYPIGM